MNERDQSLRTGRRPRFFLMGALLFVAGMLIGLATASDLGWMPFGHAVPESPKLVRKAVASPVAIPLPPPGGGGQDFVSVAKAVMPAVVNIVSTRVGTEGQGLHGLLDDPLFRRFFGEEFSKRFEEPKGREERQQRGLGSGVIVDPSGIIITNNHVVRHADKIRVLLADKTEYEATLLGTDPKTDLAVLKIDAESLLTIPWADSDTLEVGEYVLAFGNPFGLNQTVTMGIVSAVGRARMGIAEYEDFIQTDAAINPGNSGGALVNARGELVGINTAIFSRSGGSMGIGFAVPSNMARAILDQLVTTGQVVRGWLGVSIQDLTPELAGQFEVSGAKGVLVSDVLDDSPAEQAGLERGDVIVAFDGTTVEDATQLKNVVAITEVGKEVTVELIRDKQVRTLRVRIGQQPKTVARAPLTDPGASAAPAGILSGLDVRELNHRVAERLGVANGERGLVIVKVRSGSVAKAAGLKAGDLIIEVNRTPVRTLGQYERVAANVNGAPRVLLLIQRQGRVSFITLKP